MASGLARPSAVRDMREYNRRQLEVARFFPRPAYYYGLFHAALDDDAQAFYWLQKAARAARRRPAPSSPPRARAGLAASTNTARPSFIADLPGDYVAHLAVTDADGLTSAPDSVVVSSLNAAPSADAGPDQGTLVGNAVRLDGSASRDPDLDPLSFQWTLAGPEASEAVLTGETTAFPTFTPDVAGSYTATVRVSDPVGAFSTDSMVVMVIAGEQFAQERILIALNLVGALSPSEVTSSGDRKSLQKLLGQALAALQAGDVLEARSKLVQAIERTDGCVARGAPDGQGSGRDWVTSCTAQETLFQLLAQALDALTS